MAETMTSVRHFGFNLPDVVLQMIFNSYDGNASGNIGFDEYIQLLAELNALTSNFRRYDPGNTGMVHIDFNTFMTLVFSTRA